MTLTSAYDLDLQSPASYGNDLPARKVEDQRSVNSEDRVETNKRNDGRMEATALPPMVMRSVKIFTVYSSVHIPPEYAKLFLQY